MDVLTRVWICSVLLCASFSLVESSSCATAALVTRVTEIVTNLTSLQSSLPATINYSNPDHISQYNTVLNDLCSTYRPLMDEVANATTDCISILVLVPSLATLEIIGKTFPEIYSSFGSLDEFCNCSSYIMSAWSVANMSDVLKTTDSNVAFSPYARIDTYCQSSTFSGLVDALFAGISVCPPLATEADLVENSRINETKQLIADYCSSFDQTKYNCAITQSATTDLKTCMTDIASNSSLTTAEKQCARYNCVESHIESSCDTTGRDAYIAAVNLRRSSGGDILIATQDCDPNANSRSTIITMTQMAALAFFLLYYII